MLQITLVNLRGTEHVADYFYEVSVNGAVIASGTVVRHLRAKGWRALVQKLLAAEGKKVTVCGS